MNTWSLLKIALAVAVLLSSAQSAFAQGKTKLLWLGQAGWRIESPGGKVIVIDPWLTQWHMGDTGLFPDMQFISEHYKPDLVLMPIGGNFTMDPADAAFAARTWVKSKTVIPMHYGANPLMKGTPVRVIVMTEGQTVEF